jgi:tetratricopeptide (TPR) repeat protein
MTHNPRLALLARAALLVTLIALLLVTWWPSLVAALHNNLGSLALNRTLLTPDQTAEEHVAYAARAGQRFQIALAWNPLNGPAYHNLATIYDAWQDYASAARALSRAAALMPRDPVTQLKHGLALARRGQEMGAVEAWRAGGAATYFLQRGQAQGDPEAALQHYQRAVTIDPDSAEAQLRLGQALSRLGRKEEALAAFSAAAAADPGQSERPHLLQAEIHVAREEWTAALVAYRDAADRSPRDPEPHYRRGWLLSEKLQEHEEAVVAFRRALQIDPDHEPSRLALGRLEMERGACDAAATWLEPLLRVPREAGGSQENVERASRLHVLLGSCLVEQGHRSAAISHLEQARALDPQAPSTLLDLGQTYARAGRYEDAIDTYLHVLELDPSNEQARQGLEELEYDQYPGSGTTGGG